MEVLQAPMQKYRNVFVHSDVERSQMTTKKYQSLKVSPVNSIRNSISVHQHAELSELRLSFENKKSASFKAQ
jgi:hypothetical protein